MKKFLVGISGDTLNDSLYPFILVDEIDKDTLLRSKKEIDFIVINLYDSTFFNSAKNQWEKLEEYEKYGDQWENDG